MAQCTNIERSGARATAPRCGTARRPAQGLGVCAGTVQVLRARRAYYDAARVLWSAARVGDAL